MQKDIDQNKFTIKGRKDGRKCFEITNREEEIGGEGEEAEKEEEGGERAGREAREE